MDGFYVKLSQDRHRLVSPEAMDEAGSDDPDKPSKTLMAGSSPDTMAITIINCAANMPSGPDQPHLMDVIPATGAGTVRLAGRAG